MDFWEPEIQLVELVGCEIETPANATDEERTMVDNAENAAIARFMTRAFRNGDQYFGREAPQTMNRPFFIALECRTITLGKNLSYFTKAPASIVNSVCRRFRA